jgi:hypothetical protein
MMHPIPSLTKGIPVLLKTRLKDPINFLLTNEPKTKHYGSSSNVKGSGIKFFNFRGKLNSCQANDKKKSLEDGWATINLDASVYSQRIKVISSHLDARKKFQNR